MIAFAQGFSLEGLASQCEGPDQQRSDMRKMKAQHA
jgi:hypothetical protein